MKARIVKGSIVLLSGSTMAVAINLAYNVFVARFLGPKGFGNANALYTLLTLISAITLSFQIVTAKIVAQQSDDAKRDAGYRHLQHAAWVCGIAVASILIIFQRQITSYLDLPRSILVTLLATGAAFYVPLGCRRGYIQGAYGFRKLAMNLVLEGAARLVGSVLMIWAGFGVEGVIIANSAAMAISYLAIKPKLSAAVSNPITFKRGFQEVSHATVFFAGQVLINNADIVLVKHFFSSRDAGLYAAIAMVGRVVFSCSSAIVNSMFPVIAGSRREDRKSLSLIGTTLLLVSGMGALMAVVLRLMPSQVWTLLFGSSFQIQGPHGFPHLLSLYAITTVVYCLSVVVMTYEMSYKIANTNWFQLLFSIVLIAGICKYHSSLQQVIVVQLVLLTGFLCAIAIPFLLDMLINSELLDGAHDQKLRILRGLREDEVISGFLRSEFQHEIYKPYRQTHSNIVYGPDLDNAAENAARRMLLNMRHRALMQELPHDTQWYEVEITSEDLNRICVFPRAQWARAARGTFGIKKIAERIHSRQANTDDPFAQKIVEIRAALNSDSFETGPVILIGVNSSEPLTVLDGNHRFVAGVLENHLKRLRFICGLSTSMTQCCWYRTNLPNLARYARNLLRAFLDVPNTEVLNLCETSGPVPGKATPPVL